MAEAKHWTWSEAVAALLDALGAEVLGETKGPSDMQRVLGGLNYAADIQSVVGVELPEVNGGGLLVELTDKSWLPIVDLGNGVFRLVGGEVITDLTNWPITARVVRLYENPAIAAKPLSFLRRYKGRAADIMFGGLLVNLFALCFPLFGAFVYDKVLNNGITETLWALAIGLVLLVGLDYSIRAIRALLLGRFTLMSDLDIDRSVFEKILGSNLATQPSIGRVLSQYKQILGSRDFLSSGAMLAAIDIPFFFLFLVIIAWIAGWLVLVPIVLGMLLVTLHVLFSIPTLEAEKASRMAGEKRFTLLANVLASREAVVGGRFADALRMRWRRSSLNAGENQSRSRYWHALAFAASVDFTSLAYVSTMVVGVHMIEAHTLTAGGLLACTILTSRAMGALSQVVAFLIRFRELKIALVDLDQTLPTPVPAATQRKRGRLSGGLRLTGVSCQLRESVPPALDNVSLQIQAGEVVGIAGHPGAGKSTLLRAIAGVLRPTSGDILLDNIPLSALSAVDVSDNFAYKPQDACLFEGTLEDNLCLGQGDVTPDDMTKALQDVGLMPMIAQGSLSYMTEVGSGGACLSGGQKQMVMLARTLIGAPSVLLLDEPTTGLDSPAEKHLVNSLRQRKGETTMLICTHSRELLNICDRIVVLDRGRIVANGPRDKILGVN